MVWFSNVVVTLDGGTYEFEPRSQPKGAPQIAAVHEPDRSHFWNQASTARSASAVT